MAASTSRNVGSASSAPSAGTAKRRISAFNRDGAVTGDPPSRKIRCQATSRASTEVGGDPSHPGRDPQAGRDREVDVAFGGGVVGDRDPDEPAPAPGGSAQPAGALPLHSGGDGVVAGVVAETDQHLVEHDVVDDLGPCCRQFVAEPAGQPAAGAEIVNDVVLNQVLVSFGDDARNDAIVAGVQREGTCWLGGTTWRGRRLIRISVSNYSTTERDVCLSVAAI